MVQQLSVQELAARLDAGEDILLVDVREPFERDLAHLAGDVHIPMYEFPMRIREVPRNRPVVIYCHHGHRSLRAAFFLVQRGWKNVANLAGGIEAWSREVDPAMARY